MRIQRKNADAVKLYDITPVKLKEAAEKIVIYESYLTKKTTTSAKTRQPVWLSFNL